MLDLPFHGMCQPTKGLHNMNSCSFWALRVIVSQTCLPLLFLPVHMDEVPDCQLFCLALSRCLVSMYQQPGTFLPQLTVELL
eukprot:g26031.t1